MDGLIIHIQYLFAIHLLHTLKYIHDTLYSL